MVLLAAALFGVFAFVTAFVCTGSDAVLVDRPVVDWVLGARGESVTDVAIAITHSGGSAAMWLVGLLTCGVLLWRAAWADCVLVAGVGVAAAVLSPVLKHLIGRPRPPVDDRLLEVTSPAFPSGHSLGASALIGIVAVVVCGRMVQRWAIRLTALLAAAFVLVVGLSRVYLGVHWPTDVLAGWALGALLVVGGTLIRSRFGPGTSGDGRAIGDSPTQGTEVAISAGRGSAEALEHRRPCSRRVPVAAPPHASRRSRRPN